MGFNKPKVLGAAEKFLSQGKIPAAIKEYEKIVEDDPEDLTTLNMLGDLYARSDNKQEATQCFLRIAEHYREEGFQSKAIAMYKKIDRLNPRSPEIANKLAARHVLIVGENEITAGQYALKDMASGEQNNLALDQIIQRLQLHEAN